MTALLVVASATIGALVLATGCASLLGADFDRAGAVSAEGDGVDGGPLVTDAPAPEPPGPTGRGVGSCPAGTSPCDGSCVDMMNDEAHCGRCANACARPENGTATCSGGVCGVRCGDGFNRCGSSCRADSPTSCGASCAVCNEPPGGVAACSAGSCGVTCMVAVAQVSAGAHHTCARMTDGKVRCWGRSAEGQTGGSTPTTPVAGLSGAVEISSGFGHGCARMNDGTVRCWGFNSEGQTAGSDTTTAVAMDLCNQ